MQEKGRRFRRPFLLSSAARLIPHFCLALSIPDAAGSAIIAGRKFNPTLNRRNQGSADAGIRDASVTSTIRMSDRWPAVPILADLRLSGILPSQPIQSRFNTARNLYRGDLQPRREGSSVESSTGLSNATKSLMGSVLLDERSVGHLDQRLSRENLLKGMTKRLHRGSQRRASTIIRRPKDADPPQGRASPSAVVIGFRTLRAG